MSALTHNTCANVCFAPSHSEEAVVTPFFTSRLWFCLCFISVFVILEEWIKKKKKNTAQLSHFWADEAHSNGQRTCQSPLIPNRMEVNSGAQLPCLCTHAQTPWWSGRRHDKQLRNCPLACVAHREWIFKSLRTGTETGRQREREIEMEMERELKSKRGEKKLWLACA